MPTSFPMRNMRVRFAGESNIGRKRQLNEDSFHIPGEAPLAVVADGMGGHASGEVASRMAVETVVAYFRDTADEPEVTWPYKIDGFDQFHANRLTTAVKLANQRIWQRAQHSDGQHGMGTTIVAALFTDDKALIAHVGDSRIYRIRDGKITQLTEDHSLLNDYIRMKKLRVEDVGNFQHKNVIVRALGMKEQVQVDITRDTPRVGDIYCLCSDGLSGMVPDMDILRLAAGEADIERACGNLINAANAAGGVDNITAILVRMEGDLP
jgi:PPM family protein phosphatase